MSIVSKEQTTDFMPGKRETTRTGHDRYGNGKRSPLPTLALWLSCIFGGLSLLFLYFVVRYFRQEGAAGAGGDSAIIIGAGLALSVCGVFLSVLVLYREQARKQETEDNENFEDIYSPYITAFEQSGDGIGIVGDGGIILFANQKLAALYGYDDPDDMKGQLYRQHIPLSQRRDWDCRIYPALLKEGTWRGPQKIIRRDNEIFVQDVAMTIAGKGRWIFTVREYSELMEVMNISNNRLAAIEAAGDGIGIIDSKGRLVYMNRSLMELHGIPESDSYAFMGSSWYNLYSAKGREQVRDTVMPVIHETGEWRGETPLRKQDGSVIHTEMTLTRLPDGGLIGTARDITKRKKAESERQKLQRQVFQAQKMESIGRLAGGIAHDFNNILASMMGYLEFLLEDLPPQSQEHYFTRQIMHGGIQARSLIEQILAFSRRKESDMSRLDLVDTVTDIIALLKATLPPTLELESRMNIAHAEIVGNATQISQTLMNLCVNAADAMEDRSGTLEVDISYIPAGDADFAFTAEKLPDPQYAPKIHIQAPDTSGRAASHPAAEEHTLYLGQISTAKPYVKITVSDTGTGIDPEILQTIFEPFFTTKDVDKGTGLGLSTVMGMVSAHRGALRLKTAVDKGTSFEIYYPCETYTDTEKPGMMDARGPVYGSGTILLVEDEDTVLGMMKEMLGRLGYDLIICRTPGEAIGILDEREKDIDLVLSDHMMPGMTGVELAGHIDKTIPGLPVILVSGYKMDALVEAKDSLSCLQAVLKKPVDSYSLGQALKKAFVSAEKDFDQETLRQAGKS